MRHEVFSLFPCEFAGVHIVRIFGTLQIIPLFARVCLAQVFAQVKKPLTVWKPQGVMMREKVDISKGSKTRTTFFFAEIAIMPIIEGQIVPVSLLEIGVSVAVLRDVELF